MAHYRLRRTKRPLAIPENVFYADTPEKCEEAVRRIQEWDVVGVDTEAYGADIRKQSPVNHQTAVSMQFATDATDYQVFVPLWGAYAHNLEIFRAYLEDEKPTKVAHNFKYDGHVFLNHGVRMRGLLADTLVMHYLQYNGEQYHALKEVIRQLFGEDTMEFSETFKVPLLKKNGEPSKKKKAPPLSEVVKTQAGLEKLIAYGGKDPWYTARLFRRLEKEMRETAWTAKGSYYDYYRMFELPYTDVLFEMERRGCLLDMEQIECARVQVGQDMARLDRDILQEAARLGAPSEFLEKYNLNSGAQLAALLEKHLGVQLMERTPKGAPSTGKETLGRLRDRNKKLRHLLTMLLERSGMKTLRGTYIEKFGPLASQYGGRLFTTFKQTGTETGRLASAGPNLQNIPKAGKDKFGIRRMFTAPEGMVIGDIDLSQVEVRLAAHFTQDPMLLKAIRQGWDIHALTATNINAEVQAFVHGRPLNAQVLAEVKERFPEIRDKAKPILFGTFYGMGARSYAAQVGVSLNDGYRAMDGFFALYSGLKTGIQNTQQYCRSKGHIRTLLRRYCQIPNINSSNDAWRSYAERQAFNFQIQGSCADLLKMGMILIEQDARLKSLGVRMTLQIHDELLFEVPKDAVTEAKPLIEEYVSYPYRHFGMKDLLVDTPAEFGVGDSWQTAKK